MNEIFRAPTPRELEILRKMIREDFQGAENLRTQLEDFKVRTTVEDKDNYESIEIKTKKGMAAKTGQRVPVEGVAYDTDGVKIFVLLHVAEGLIVELEFYKVDGSPIISQPQAKDFTMHVREINPDNE